MSKKLYRSDTDSVIFGVCGGLGRYFDIDPVIFRILFVALALGGGLGVFVYIVLAIVLPKRPDEEKFDLDERVNDLSSEFGTMVESGKRRNLLGWSIIAVGIFLLLNTIVPWTIFSWGVFWALVIIVLGVVVLGQSGRLNGLGEEIEKISDEIESEVKEEVKNERKERDKGVDVFGIFFGILLVVLGGALLLGNYDLLPENLTISLSDLLRFWPILIILLGLSFLSKGSLFNKVVVLIITLVITFFALWVVFTPNANVQERDLNVPVEEGVTRSEISLKLSAARINISGGAEGSLITGTYRTSGPALGVDSRSDNETQMVELRAEGREGVLFDHFMTDPRYLDLRMLEDVPISLAIESGASSIKIDSSDFLMESLRLDSGASGINLVFGEMVDHTDVFVNAGASSIDITIPEMAGARVEFTGALANKNLTGFVQIEEDIYESDNFEEADQTVFIRIDAAVSNVKIDRR